jgi:CRISPR-associated endonuclease/helicase Cas3
LVEASMGEGKTEAALYLADYLQHKTSVGGFYLGLPTQATSNAMWKRVQAFLQQRYPDISNLTLSHSAAALKAEYLESVCRLDQVYDKDKRVLASEWHTARKRSLLSPYGVGTIDQGLMGVVRSRHQFVRLFGLAGRTVILDEIHAYDLYTSTLLERFLEWLALLGSPVIALSATLPTDTRRKLVNAYAKGCGISEPELPQSEYPRITAFTQAGVQVQSFAASEHVRRSLNLQWVSGVENDKKWAAALQNELADGGCAAVICSTVGRAQKVFQRLQEHFPDYELGLFHGRFLFIDRERIERDCQSMFGKDSIKFIVLLTCVMALENALQDLLNLRVFIAYLLYVSRRTRPYRYVLIATQVIEQSLDVDFDLMISDLAPVDLLLQRSGRLHRHDRDRPPQLQKTTMWLIAPTLDKKGKTDFGESRWIYDRHVLLRSWLTLRDQVSIQLPEETDSIIESVYNLDAEIPNNLAPIHCEDWQTSLADYQKDRDEQTSNAKDVRIPHVQAEINPEDFTSRGLKDDESAVSATTRLGDLSVTTIFVQQTEEGLVLPISRAPVNLKKSLNLAQIRELLNHSTRISKKGLVEVLLAQPKPENWTSALLRSCRYVELDAQDIAQVGNWKLSLKPQLGVVIDSA